MTDERRLDELLDAALEAGSLPDASPDEQRELRELLEGAQAVRSTAAAVDAEAGASMPIARARFERFLFERRPPAATPALPMPTQRRSRRPWAFAFAGAAVVLIVALLGIRALFTGAETASAEVLVPGDYAQVEGVVTAVTDSDGTRSLTVAAQFGRFQVDVASDTDITTETGTGSAADIAAGARVAVAGDVGEGGRIAARSLAVGTPDAVPGAKAVTRLEVLSASLSVTVLGVALPQDDSPARVVVQTASGQQYVVRVDAVSTERLLRLARVLGASVTITTQTTAGAFTLEVSDQAPPSPAAGPRLRTVRGVIVAREMNLITVQTADALVMVAVRPATRLLLADSGLVREAFVRGREAAVGHTVSVTGSLQRLTGRVIADVLVIGPRADN